VASAAVASDSTFSPVLITRTKTVPAINICAIPSQNRKGLGEDAREDRPTGMMNGLFA
jgi:hypothetical protein